MGKNARVNKLCSCGSGKKYKKCCMNKVDIPTVLRDKLHDLLENTQSGVERYKLEKRLKEVEKIISKNDFNKSEIDEINTILFQVYSLLGEDNKALNIMDSLDDYANNNIMFKAVFLSYKMRSLLNIGDLENTIKVLSEAQDLFKNMTWSDKNSSELKSGLMLETGKILMIILKSASFYMENTVDYEDCHEIFDMLIEKYESNKYDNIDHYLGAKSNKASIFLESNSKEINDKGIELMLEVISEKRKVGYLLGIANNYSTLGLFYLKNKDYKQAIAYTKKDLSISKTYGSLRDQISTLVNLSDIYLELKQITEAKSTLREALNIAKKTKNPETERVINEKITKVSVKAKNLHQNNISFGSRGMCQCGSENSYENCCGEADFDYEDISKVMGLDYLIPYGKLMNYKQNETLKSTVTSKEELDLILRKLDNEEIRLSWVNITSKGAFQEIYELPDMTSINLTSAKSLVSLHLSNDNNIIEEMSIAMAASMLSIAALEAFLNQMICFLSDIPTQELPEFIKLKIPNELLEDALEYQRNTRMIDKVNIIANILSNNNWRDNAKDLSRDLFKLISIRNELVHFKSIEHIKIIPPQKEHNILKNLSPKVKLRDVSNSWPFKLLNLSFATWSIETVQDSINFIKDSYNKTI